MDARQQTINSFTGGLNMDLHPLTTPNNILTDCINGTILTYNGNEYILQNDMGNYKLATAQLDSNYIPVGIKEYGNIIYIVSYNPVDKKCQIGSYPSPQTIFNNEGDHNSLNDYDGIVITPKVGSWEYEDLETISEKTPNLSVFYTDLSKKETVKLYSTTEKFKLVTGDRYYIYVEKNASGYLQSINFYVLSEEKELYEIDQSLITTHTVDIEASETDSYDYVKWEIPGWISYKSRIAPIDSFNLYLDDVNVPRYFVSKSNSEESNENKVNIDLTIQAQIAVSDKIWNQEQYGAEANNGSIPKNYEGLYVRFQYKIGEESNWRPAFGEDVELKTSQIATYNNVNNYYFNWTAENIEVTSSQVIKIRAIPFVKFGDKTIVVYDNHKTELEFTLDDLFNVDNIRFFDVFKYTVDDNSINLNFTVQAPIRTEQYTAWRRLYKLDNNPDTTKQSLIWIPITEENKEPFYIQDDNIDLLGQSIIELEDIKAESGIYLFVIELWENAEVDDETGKPKGGTCIRAVGAPIIASKAMNAFYSTESQFQFIARDKWIKEAIDQLTISLNHFTVEKAEDPKEDVFTTEILSNLYNNNVDSEDLTSSNNHEKSISDFVSKKITPAKSKYIGIREYQKLKIEANTPSILFFSEIIQDNSMWSTWKSLDFSYNNLFKYYVTENNITKPQERSESVNSFNYYSTTGLYTYANAQPKTIKGFNRTYLYNFIPVPYNRTFYPKLTENSGWDEINEKLKKVFNKFDTKSLNGNDPAISKLPVIVLNHFPGDSKKFRLRPKVRNLGTIGVNDSASKDMGSITYLEPKDNDWAFTIYANNEDTDAADWSRLQSYFADTLLSNKLSITPVVFQVQWPTSQKQSKGGYLFEGASFKAQRGSSLWGGNLIWVSTSPTLGILCTNDSKNSLAIIAFNNSKGNFTVGIDPEWSVGVNTKYGVNISCDGTTDLIGSKFLLTGIGNSASDSNSDINKDNVRYALYILQIMGLHLYVASLAPEPISTAWYQPITSNNSISTSTNGTVTQQATLDINKWEYLNKNWMNAEIKVELPNNDVEIKYDSDNITKYQSVSNVLIKGTKESPLSFTQLKSELIDKDYSTLRNDFEFKAKNYNDSLTEQDSLIDGQIYSDFKELGLANAEVYTNKFKGILDKLIYDSSNNVIKWLDTTNSTIKVLNSGDSGCVSNTNTNATYIADWTSLDFSYEDKGELMQVSESLINSLK